MTTNELPSAGTQAQVSLTVYGHKGNSGPIPLGYADGQTFRAGQEDEFDVSRMLFYFILSKFFFLCLSIAFMAGRSAALPSESDTCSLLTLCLMSLI